MSDHGALVRLRQELGRDLGAAAVLVADLERRATRLTDDDPVLLGYVAVTVHQFYTAIEVACERICRLFEGSLPGGADGHLALLNVMTLNLPEVRPAVLREPAVAALRPLLRFRHFVRHAYAVAWNAGRLQEVVSMTHEAWPLVSADLGVFLAFLDQAIAECRGEP